MSKVLTIAGMHRSGTSLLARYLHACGLHMGSDLLGKHPSNPAGHYEDREFLGLHNEILAAHHLDYRVSKPMDWNIDPATRQRAASLIAARHMHPQWGWKDPRTCLFLPLWKSLVPDCFFIITYRPAEPTIRSLIARDILTYHDKTSRLQRWRSKRFQQEEIQQLCNTYLRVWIWYNREIIRHIVEDPSVRYACISFEQLIHSNFQILPTLQRQGFDLHPPQQFDFASGRGISMGQISVTLDNVLMDEIQNIDDRFQNILHAQQNLASAAAP